MSIDCRRWDDLYDDWREGRLSAAEAEACRVHAAECPRCAELLDLLAMVRAEIEAPDLTAEILADTTGSTCGRAHRLTATRFDGELDPHAAALLDAHLEHCAACAEIARCLAWLKPVLRQLAVVEPDPRLVYDVLRATSSQRARRRSGPWGRFRERAGAWWSGQIRRPLFAWETAFSATVLAVLIFGTPLSPAPSLPGHALAAIQTAPVWVAERTVDAVNGARKVVGEIQGGLTNIELRTGPVRHDLRQLARRTGRALRAVDIQELKNIGSDLDDAWESLFSNPERSQTAAENTVNEATPLRSGPQSRRR